MPPIPSQASRARGKAGLKLKVTLIVNGGNTAAIPPIALTRRREA